MSPKQPNPADNLRDMTLIPRASEPPGGPAGTFTGRCIYDETQPA